MGDLAIQHKCNWRKSASIFRIRPVGIPQSLQTIPAWRLWCVIHPTWIREAIWWVGHDHRDPGPGLPHGPAWKPARPAGYALRVRPPRNWIGDFWQPSCRLLELPLTYRSCNRYNDHSGKVSTLLCPTVALLRHSPPKTPAMPMEPMPP
jgi:hypothetical protein